MIAKSEAGRAAAGGQASWEDYVAEQECLGEVEAELREAAADRDDAGLVRLGERLLAALGPATRSLMLEFRSPVTGRVVRRVEVRPPGAS